jgi:hypothetical protein|tara:strand:- start:9852 stop:10937 length:1086 start_codon:yes stop_codon:yes gene_type:complete
MADETDIKVQDLPDNDPRVSRTLAVKNLFFDKGAWQTMELMCQKFAQSGALPSTINNASKAIVVVQTGLEMGLAPMQSINSLYLINGRVGVEGKVYLQKMMEAGVQIEWHERTDEKASATFKYKDRPEYKIEFTTQDFTSLLGKDNWKKWPRNMLMWKVVEDAGRFYCPEVLHGAEVRDAWDVVDVQPAEDVPDKLKTKQEQKAEVVEAEEVLPEDAQGILDMLNVAETEEDLEACREAITNESWGAHAARQLSTAYANKVKMLKAGKPEVVDTAEAAEEVFGTGTKEGRLAELQKMKSVDLKPILEELGVDYTGMDKAQRISTILEEEFADKTEDTPPPPESPAPQEEENPFLDKLLEAK